MTKKSKQGKSNPSNPPNPRYAVVRSGHAVAGSIALPSWMYGDPADVVERIENGHMLAQASEAERAERRQRQRFGLVGESTVRLIKRARIRELLANVMMGKKR